MVEVAELVFMDDGMEKKTEDSGVTPTTVQVALPYYGRRPYLPLLSLLSFPLSFLLFRFPGCGLGTRYTSLGPVQSAGFGQAC